MNSDLNHSEHLAEILEPTDENLQICANEIRKGNVVGMPTETVYGLAANCFNIEAVRKIFEYKGRPLSDPLIVHVTSTEMAEELLDIDAETRQLFRLLSDKYWPGPLTMVLKANQEKINPIITAETGYVGIRFPKHPLAQQLINLSGFPLAAPSANKFCHVSPVNPKHVFDDFKEFTVKIINGGICTYTMESTVIKILSDLKEIHILRLGAISPDDLRNFLGENDSTKLYRVIYNKPVKKITIEEEINENQLAPGQFIKHYAPQIETFILRESSDNYVETDVKNICVIDYNSTILKKYGNIFGQYIDLSPNGGIEETISNLYSYLRWAEVLDNIELILLCDIENSMEDNPHKVMLVDRVNKASSSRYINLK